MSLQGGQSGVATEVARQAAQRAHGLADHLDRHEPAELLDQVRAYARRRPVAFLAGAAVLGVLAGRMTRGLASSDNGSGTRQLTGSTTSQLPTYPASGYPAEYATGSAAYPAGTGYSEPGFPAVGAEATGTAGYEPGYEPGYGPGGDPRTSPTTPPAASARPASPTTAPAASARPASPTTAPAASARTASPTTAPADSARTASPASRPRDPATRPVTSPAYGPDTRAAPRTRHGARGERRLRLSRPRRRRDRPHRGLRRPAVRRRPDRPTRSATCSAG